MAVKTKFYNLDTDTTLGGNSASDLYIASQKAVKTYVDNKTPTVNDATLTITQNNTAKGTFTANASTDVSINITVPTKTSDLTNDDGFITGITSSDVTTALGYTPYNSTNPSGYQANVIETVKVNGSALTPTNKAVDISVPTISDTYSATSSDGMSGKAVASALTDYVPTSRTINGKALSSNITLSASDVSALPSSTVIPTVTFRAWS